MQEFAYLTPDSILVTEGRQRTKVDPSDLIPSIQARGILNPLIVTREGVLVAGERRLKAALALGLTSVPVRYFDQLSLIEAKIIELEENLKRQDLTWRDEAKAIVQLHELYTSAEGSWSQKKTADAISISETQVSMAIRVVKDFDLPAIAQASSISAAHNILARRDSRAIHAAMSELTEAGASLFDEEEEGDSAAQPELPWDGTPLPERPRATAETASLAPAARPEDLSILHADFALWAPSYEGPRFNFLHCDFPYGINAFGGPQSGRDKWTTYDDSPTTYWDLISALCTHLDRFCAPEAHIMFWLAGDVQIQAETIRIFGQLAPSFKFQTYPIYWIKSDNVGVLPDPKRGPRRIVETALIGSREDRLIAKPVSNAYSAPTDKAHHASTKPEPMLRHFFQMFVDESTKMLDPTCGSGSALRAAESLGAKAVLGLERDEEHCANARSALRTFRARKALEKLS